MQMKLMEETIPSLFQPAQCLSHHFTSMGSLLGPLALGAKAPWLLPILITSAGTGAYSFTFTSRDE